MSFKFYSNNSRGSVAIIVFWISLIVIGFVVLPFFVFGKVVPPEMIGLRQNYYGLWGVLDKGYQEKGLEPGLHWKIPYVSNVLLFPRGFQFVHLKNDKERGNLNLPVLDVPTTDGSKVKTDITLVLRFYQEPETAKDKKEELDFGESTEVPFVEQIQYNHKGPKELVNSLTADNTTQLKTFSSIAENELRKFLSSLSTTNFYNPVLREQAALKASHEINKKVSDSGIELWASLIRRYTYAEKNIDDQIFAKNLQDQTEQLNAASSRLAEAKALTEQASALWDAKIRDLKVDGESKVQVTRSEGDLYEKKKMAEADLLVAKATAEVDQAKANALTSISGADVYIAREMAPLLATLKGGVVADIDPFDINAWVKKLVANDS